MSHIVPANQGTFFNLAMIHLLQDNNVLLLNVLKITNMSCSYTNHKAWLTLLRTLRNKFQ